MIIGRMGMLFSLGIPLLVHAAPADEHAGHDMSSETAGSAGVEFIRDNSPAMQQARHETAHMHGGMINYMLLGERVERQAGDGEDSLVWEVQGWAGGDINKLWLKTEGRYDTGSKQTEDAEVQALYSRAIAPFWDLQAGLRHDAGDGELHGDARAYVVIGLMGLAPLWFELDAAAFVSDQGDVSARVETEYDLRFTQRLFLQPRLELNYSFADDPDAGTGKGITEAGFGLRLRYEFRREFAPYLGVEWSRAYGNTAALMAQAGEDRESVNVVAGVRFWY